MDHSLQEFTRPHVVWHSTSPSCVGSEVRLPRCGKWKSLTKKTKRNQLLALATDFQWTKQLSKESAEWTVCVVKALSASGNDHL